MIEKHPLLTNHVILPTNELERFTNELRGWLDDLSTGAYVWGKPRLGKTSTIRFLIKYAEKLLEDDIPCELFSCWDPKVNSVTENRFFTELLRVFKHEYPKSGTASDKRIRLLNLIEDRVLKNDEHRIILFFDEAHWLHDVQLNYLMDIHNQLKMKDITLITILVGQPELVSRRHGLVNNSQLQIVSRFMCNEFHFHGIKKQADLKAILKYIDTGSEFPSGSNITYTQHFIPLAFENGWRLEHQTDRIWQLLHRELQQRGLLPIAELPMQPIMAVIRRMLRLLSARDDVDLTVPDEFISSIIDKVAIEQIQMHLLDFDMQTAA